MTLNTIKGVGCPQDAAPAAANLAAGTMVSCDLRRSRSFYEEFLGLECVQYAKDRLLIRDSHGGAAMNAARQDFFVIEVQQVAAIANPRRMLHHWGIDVNSTAEVERIHAEATRRREGRLSDASLHSISRSVSGPRHLRQRGRHQ